MLSHLPFSNSMPHHMRVAATILRSSKLNLRQFPPINTIRYQTNLLLTSRTFHTSKAYRVEQPQWPYLYSSKRIMAPQLDAYFEEVDSLSNHFIDRLSRAVAIPSVSAEDERRPEVVRVSLTTMPYNHTLANCTFRWANG
jgi:hypothetical protein